MATKREKVISGWTLASVVELADKWGASREDCAIEATWLGMPPCSAPVLAWYGAPDA